MRIIQRLNFLFLNENICCDPSLELSRRDSSNGESQNIFYAEIWLIIPKLSPLPLLIWSTASPPGVLTAHTAQLTVLTSSSILRFLPPNGCFFITGAEPF